MLREKSGDKRFCVEYTFQSEESFEILVYHIDLSFQVLWHFQDLRVFQDLGVHRSVTFRDFMAFRT